MIRLLPSSTLFPYTTLFRSRLVIPKSSSASFQQFILCTCPALSVAIAPSSSCSAAAPSAQKKPSLSASSAGSCRTSGCGTKHGRWPVFLRRSRKQPCGWGALLSCVSTISITGAALARRWRISATSLQPPTLRKDCGRSSKSARRIGSRRKIAVEACTRTDQRAWRSASISGGCRSAEGPETRVWALGGDLLRLLGAAIFAIDDRSTNGRQSHEADYLRCHHCGLGDRPGHGARNLRKQSGRQEWQAAGRRCAQQLPEKMQTGSMRAKGGELGGQETLRRRQEQFHEEMREGCLSGWDGVPSARVRHFADEVIE